MIERPDFLDNKCPEAPNIVVPRAVLPFFLTGGPARGVLVRLGPLAQALLTRHDHPASVQGLAGEALALVAGLAAGLKFQGSFSLQARGDGPVGFLQADCTDSGALRCYARVEGERLARLLAADPAPSARALLGDGALAFTVDQGEGSERYQGIITIAGEHLAEMAGHYFAASEQFACKLVLASAPSAEGWRAGALVLQRLGGSAAEEEEWHSTVLLAAALTAAELLDDALPAERVLHKLFPAPALRLARPRALSYGCRCSRARLKAILAGFMQDDLDHMTVDGAIVMTCEFCNLDFRFEREELGTAGQLTGEGEKTQ